MKTTFLKLLVIFLSILFISCRKDDDIPTSDIYVAGSQYDANGKQTAQYWKNGTGHILDTGPYSSGATDIIISGNDVYVCGFTSDSNSNFNAVLWKNGVAVFNGSASENNSAESVLVNNGDVYLAGWQRNNTTSNYVAKYWKNGTEHNLTNETTSAGARDICINGTDIYVVGFKYVQSTSGYYQKAVLWKNGTETILSSFNTHSEAKAVYVDGTDVYVVGQERSPQGYNRAFMWKNGSLFYLNEGTVTDNGYARDVTVINGEVYITGYNQQDNWYGACYWKNNVMYKLSEQPNTSSMEAIFVKNNEIYTAGTIRNGNNIEDAVYFKNNTKTILSNDNYNATAYSIFIN